MFLVLIALVMAFSLPIPAQQTDFKTCEELKCQNQGRICSFSPDAGVKCVDACKDEIELPIGEIGQCSIDNRFCDVDGTTRFKCDVCGCSQGHICGIDNTCRKVCNDGTLEGQCAKNLPMLCQDGILMQNAQVCGCEEGMSAQSDGTCGFIGSREDTTAKDFEKGTLKNSVITKKSPGNLALSGTAFASSVYDAPDSWGYEPEPVYLNDRVSVSRDWISEFTGKSINTGQFMGIEWNESQAFNEIYFAQAMFLAKSYKVQYWKEDNWVDLTDVIQLKYYPQDFAEFDFNYNLTYTHGITFELVNSTKVRVFFPECFSACRVWELEVYNTQESTVKMLNSAPAEFVSQVFNTGITNNNITYQKLYFNAKIVEAGEESKEKNIALEGQAVVSTSQNAPNINSAFLNDGSYQNVVVIPGDYQNIAPRGTVNVGSCWECGKTIWGWLSLSKDYINDGISYSYGLPWKAWVGAGKDLFFYIEFPEEHTFTYLYFYQLYDNIQNYRIMYWDGFTWKFIPGSFDATGAAILVGRGPNLEDIPITTNKIGITIDSTFQNKAPIITEFQAFESQTFPKIWKPTSTDKEPFAYLGFGEEREFDAIHFVEEASQIKDYKIMYADSSKTKVEYKYKSDAPGTFIDSSGNDIDGYCSGQSCPDFDFSDYKFGTSALNFPAGGWFKTKDSSSLQIRNEITLATWFKDDLQSFAYWDTYWDRKIINKGDFDYSLYIPSYSGTFNFVLNSLGSLNSNIVPEKGKWYHVAGTYDGRIMRLYIDGVEVKSQEVSGLIRDIFGNDYLTIGTVYSAIDELFVFNRALAPEEIRSLYETNTVLNREGIVVEMGFDAGLQKKIEYKTTEGEAYWQPQVGSWNSVDLTWKSKDGLWKFEGIGVVFENGRHRYRAEEGIWKFEDGIWKLLEGEWDSEGFWVTKDGMLKVRGDRWRGVEGMWKWEKSSWNYLQAPSLAPDGVTRDKITQFVLPNTIKTNKIGIQIESTLNDTPSIKELYLYAKPRIIDTSGNKAKLQIRTAPNKEGETGEWTEWAGPDGTNESYFNETAQEIPILHEGNNFVQYKAILETKIADKLTELDDVKIEFAGKYNIKPFVSAKDHDVVVNEPITFTAVANDIGGYIKKYEWDFGDGNKGEGQAVNYTYTKPGAFDVSVKVTDNDGATASDNVKVFINVYDCLTDSPPGSGPDAGLFTINDPVLESVALQALREYADKTGIRLEDIDTTVEYYEAVNEFVTTHMTWTDDRASQARTGWDFASAKRTLTESRGRCGNDYCDDCEGFAVTTAALLRTLGVSDKCVYVATARTHAFNILNINNKFRIVEPQSKGITSNFDSKALEWLTDKSPIEPVLKPLEIVNDHIGQFFAWFYKSNQHARPESYTFNYPGTDGLPDSSNRCTQGDVYTSYFTDVCE